MRASRTAKFSVKKTKQSHGQSSPEEILYMTARQLVKFTPFGLFASEIISVICQITFVCCQSVTESPAAAAAAAAQSGALMGATVRDHSWRRDAPWWRQGGLQHTSCQRGAEEHNK